MLSVQLHNGGMTKEAIRERTRNEITNKMPPEENMESPDQEITTDWVPGRCTQLPPIAQRTAAVCITTPLQQ